MKRSDMLRILTLAPAGAFLASCSDGLTAPKPAEGKEAQFQVLRERGMALWERMVQAGGGTEPLKAQTRELVYDIEQWQKAWGDTTAILQKGLSTDDIPEAVKLTAAAAKPKIPWGPNCTCPGYFDGCMMYLPTGPNTCPQGSCLYICINWFCRIGDWLDAR